MYNFTTILDQKPYKEVLILKNMAGASIINEFSSDDKKDDSHRKPKEEDLHKIDSIIKSDTNSKTNRKLAGAVDETKEYVQYSSKYLKVLLVEGVTVIVLLLNCFIHHTDWPKAPIYLVIAIIGIIFSGSKLLAIQYVEYFVAITYCFSKAGISFVVAFVCDNYHTDHMGSVFIFFSCFSSFFLVTCPFIMNGLLIDGFTSPNYFILSLAICLIIIFAAFILVEIYMPDNNKLEEVFENAEIEDNKEGEDKEIAVTDNNNEGEVIKLGKRISVKGRTSIVVTEEIIKLIPLRGRRASRKRWSGMDVNVFKED
jgi:hypothetical protein